MSFEEVIRTRTGFGDDGQVMYETTLTGRIRRPESVPEWCAQRIAAMGLIARTLPGGRAVIALLEAGEDFNVKAAGRELDDWQRWGVRTELERLLGRARESYPPAARLLQPMLSAWTRAYGNREPLPPRAPRPVKVQAAQRAPSLAETGLDPAAVAASWQHCGSPRVAQLAAASHLRALGA